MDENRSKNYPKISEPIMIIFVILVSVLGAVIGIQIIAKLGITPNTSIIGALIAMLVARIPITILKKYHSIYRQNLIQTATSSATFGAANSLFIPIGIPFVMGRTDLIIPSLIGAGIAMFIDSFMLYNLFDSSLFPAKEVWAPGVATAESILAGEQGGHRAGLLGLGGIVGMIGSGFGVQMSALGVAMIGNVFALGMFGIGLLVIQYAKPLFGINLTAMYVPHGIMVGAGLVALIQAVVLIFGKNTKASAVESQNQMTRTKAHTRKSLLLGYLAYLAATLLIAFISGIYTKMPLGQFILFLLYAALAAIIHEIIVGIAAMHSGWFPAFAVALITLLIGVLLGFPISALIIMVAFSTATGPAFADMGYDLKTGYILRGNGKNKNFEKHGRKEQYIIGLIAFLVALIIMAAFHNSLFSQKLIPPIDSVYASTIHAGASASIAKALAIWAIPGAIIQFIGGPSRQLGVMFATGLLITTPNTGWAVLAGLLIKGVALKVWGKKANSQVTILAAGFIAGDALYSFGSSLFQSYRK